MKTCVYIDGFNLYYGALKGTGDKWLDIAKMSKFLLPQNDIQVIKYYTARILSRPEDPEQEHRQAVYLRALSTFPEIKIIEGQFKRTKATGVDVRHSACNQLRTIWRYEEKGSDVNLAVHMVRDACLENYDCFCVLSNDSDLAEAFRIVKDECHRRVVLVNPQLASSRAVDELFDNSNKYIKLTRGLVHACPLPSTMSDSAGDFHKPAVW